jgi:uncharacterized membrane protein YhaH (DUF805 family)
MDFMTSVRTCFTKYATFDGRASRSEFWWFYLFSVLVIMVVYVFPLFFSLMASLAPNGAVSGLFSILSLVSNLALFAVSVGLMIPLFAVGSRRLHDRGQSGWLQMLVLVPCASIALVVLWILEGTPGPNMYGPPPA